MKHFNTCRQCFVSCVILHYVGARNLFDKSLMPKLMDTDMIELYHLRSFPLLLIESSAGQFSTTTTGLALRSTSTQETIVLQYKPVNYSSCFLPILGSGKGENASIHWDKRAEVVHHNAIDITYWQQSTFLARINGVVYKNYIRWIEQYVVTNRHFSPQSICSSTSDLSCFTFAETWETFLADSYEAFASFGVRLNAILPPRAIELRYLSFTEPEMLILDRNARPTVALTEEPTSRPSISPTNKPTVIPSARSLAPSAGGSSNSTSAEVTLHRSIDRPSDISSLNSTNYPKSVSQRLLDETVDDPQLDRHERFNHGTQTQDDSLTAQMIEDAQQADNADAAAALNNQLKQGDDVMPLESVSEGEVAAYYGTVMACMEEYQLEDFTNALKSCISETIGYVHVDGDRYYRIRHRYPFIFVYDYLEAIPDPLRSSTQGTDLVDKGIICLILVAALVGFVASMTKLKLFEFFCTDRYQQTGKRMVQQDGCGTTRRRSQTASLSPHDSFYNKPVKPRPTRPSVIIRLWAAMGGTPSKYAQYSSLPTSSSEDDYFGDYLGGVEEGTTGVASERTRVRVEGVSSLETVQSDDAPQYVLDANSDLSHSFDIADSIPRQLQQANMYRDIDTVESADISSGADGHYELVDFHSLYGDRSVFVPTLEVAVGRESPGTNRRRQSGGQQ